MSLRRTLMVAVLAALIALPASAYATFQYPEAQPYVPNLKQPIPAAPVQQEVPQHQFGLVSPTYIPPGVNANGVYTTPITPASKGTTATYNLDWTLGTIGKSGCLVCHGDKNLVRIVAGVPVSMYVDTQELQNSAHAKLLCTDCHTDFAYKLPHASGVNGDSWSTVAKSACKNCHQPEFLDWAKSSHSLSGANGALLTSALGRPGSSAPGMPRPMCGDCHGGHTIPAKDDAAGQAALHASALQMCGKCHVETAANYNDYYHGAAYRRGAPDAPACWQCHSTHLILPSSNSQAPTNPDNLATTCSQCHRDPGTGKSPGYVQYAQLIHQRQEIYQKNPVYSAVDTATTVIEAMFRNMLSAFGK
jgi:hypothetical protein